MILVPCEQGSDEWIAARIGIPTSSAFDRIITKTGKRSTADERYLGKLLAEWYLNCSLDEAISDFMERGNSLESSAARFYEFENDVETVPVGFVVRDDAKAGASPDRLVGDDGLLEIKCPSPEIHMTYVLGGLQDNYKPQMQGQLWICEREWCDLLSFHPVLPPARARFHRDEAFISTLASLVDSFIERLEAGKEKLLPDKSERDAKLRELNERFG